jgi:surface antigen
VQPHLHQWLSLFNNEVQTMSGSNFKVAVLLIGMAPLVLSGCTGMSKTGMGGGIGSIAGAGAGALIGNAVGGKDGTWIGALAGAAAGGLIGAGIGAYLDDQDKQTAAAAEAQVLNHPTQPGQTASATWKSDHNPNVSGTVVVTDAGPNTQGQECKKTTHTVYSGGQEHVDNAVQCKDPRTGAWVRSA